MSKCSAAAACRTPQLRLRRRIHLYFQTSNFVSHTPIVKGRSISVLKIQKKCRVISPPILYQKSLLWIRKLISIDSILSLEYTFLFRQDASPIDDDPYEKYRVKQIELQLKKDGEIEMTEEEAAEMMKELDKMGLKWFEKYMDSTMFLFDKFIIYF